MRFLARFRLHTHLSKVHHIAGLVEGSFRVESGEALPRGAVGSRIGTTGHREAYCTRDCIRRLEEVGTVDDHPKKGRQMIAGVGRTGHDLPGCWQEASCEGKTGHMIAAEAAGLGEAVDTGHAAGLGRAAADLAETGHVEPVAEAVHRK